MLSFSPMTIWYTDRYLYSVRSLSQLVSQEVLNYDMVKKMDPVFIAINPHDKPNGQDSGIWKVKKFHEDKEKIDGNPIFLYREIQWKDTKKSSMQDTR